MRPASLDRSTDRAAFLFGTPTTDAAMWDDIITRNKVTELRWQEALPFIGEPPDVPPEFFPAQFFKDIAESMTKRQRETQHMQPLFNKAFENLQEHGSTTLYIDGSR